MIWFINDYFAMNTEYVFDKPVPVSDIENVGSTISKFISYLV